MKNIKPLIAALALCFGIAAHADTTCNKDTIVVSKPDLVKVITSDSLQTVIIEGSEKNRDFKYKNSIQLVDSNYVSTSSINDDSWEFSFNLLKKKNKNSKTQISTELAFGFCSAPGMPAAADIRTFSSWEIWWIISDAEYIPWKNCHSFAAGIGVDWRNYRMNDEKRFVKADNKLSIVPYPDGAIPRFSRIKVFSITFPLRYKFNVKHFGFSVGPVVNINTYSSIKTRYKLNGEKNKDTDKDVRAVPVTVDFMGTLHFRGINLYMKYSPCNVLKTSYAPKFRSLSFGFIL